MTAIATIIDRLTASAATEIDRRGMAEARLRVGEQPLDAEPPSQRPPQPPGPGRRERRARAATRRRWSPTPRRSRRADGHRPGRARPGRSRAARTSGGRGQRRARRRRTRDSSRSLPRIAAVGGTRDASSAGTVPRPAATAARPSRTASATCAPVSAGGAAAVAMYSVLTVALVKPTAAVGEQPPETDADHRAGEPQQQRLRPGTARAPGAA